MTREEVLAMKPGRELDALVATTLMGYELSRHQPGWVRIGSRATYPKPYSQNVSAAWEVVEKMSQKFYQVEVSIIKGEWVCNVWKSDIELYECAGGKTAPEAICLSALLSVMDL